MSYSVVIVDDEPPARAKLARFLAAHEDFRVLSEAAAVEEAIAAISSGQPDVVYLDIQLGSRSGFDVIEGLRGQCSPLIVFTTAYSEYAVRAFELQALDYLLKPFDQDRFTRSIDRIRAALAQPDRSDVEERVRRLLAHLPGRSRRNGLFIDCMLAEGRVREFAGRFEQWPVAPLDDTPEAAAEMCRRLGMPLGLPC